MFDNSILLSGSTMLQVAWNHIWHNADVDIFVTSEALSRASLMLTEAGYKEIHSMESIYADVPDPQDNVPPLRPCPIRLVARWSRTITDSVHQFKQTEQNIDVVVAWRHAPNAFVLLENFDILACKASWNGSSVHWPQPHILFSRSSALDPRVACLTQGFCLGWMRGSEYVDECVCQRQFLQTTRWRHATMLAMDLAEDFYTTEACLQLRARMIVADVPHYLQVFVRQFLRIRKYIRRGMHIHDLPDNFADVLVCLDHVRQLRWQW